MTGLVEKPPGQPNGCAALRGPVAMLAAFPCSARIWLPADGDPVAANPGGRGPQTDAQLDRRAYALLRQNKLAEHVMPTLSLQKSAGGRPGQKTG